MNLNPFTIETNKRKSSKERPNCIASATIQLSIDSG